MKRGIAILLVLLTLAALLTGCSGSETAEPTPEPTAEPSPEPTPAPTLDRSLSWAKAFRDESLEGSLTPEEIAFRYTDEEGKPGIVNVSRSEMMDWWNSQETLPRTRYYEKFMPESLQELYPALDYAMAHSFSSFCMPSTGFTPTDVAISKKCLRWTYRINNTGIGAEGRASFDLGDGRMLQYVLVTLKGMARQGTRNEYQEAIDKAREIVAGIPEGSSEYEKVLYLYSWLTDNVTYDFGEYYEDDWNLLYDTLVRKQTVCAGYAEALCVLCNLAGVECITVSGSLQTGNGWQKHIWNAAKIDGDYFQFDATWDTGLPPAYYSYFGVSEDTLQSYYPRSVKEPLEEYRPSCTRDLTVPSAPPFPAGLEPGTVKEDGYSQPFFDLSLSWDGSWTVYSRWDIYRDFYGGTALSMEQCFRQINSYVDLALERNGEKVYILLEQSPVELYEGVFCSSPADYVETDGQGNLRELEEMGVSRTSLLRFQREIGGRSYECAAVSGRVGRYSSTVTTLCTKRGNCFLTIFLIADDQDRCEQILRELLGEDPGV